MPVPLYFEKKRAFRDEKRAFMRYIHMEKRLCPVYAHKKKPPEGGLYD